jgi:hypothetical protein
MIADDIGSYEIEFVVKYSTFSHSVYLTLEITSSSFPQFESALPSPHIIEGYFLTNANTFSLPSIYNPE